MRFEDWDVLLFNGPASESGHIPLKEFKTECHAIEDASLAAGETTRPNCVSPLMTCFIPSIHENETFQISIHTWVPKHFFYAANEHGQADGAVPTQLWQVKVNVDGYDVSIEHYPGNVVWPRVLITANMFQPSIDGNMQPLRFPRFYKSVMSQHHWDANDTKGRIKVEISEGYVKTAGEGGKQAFVKLMNHAIFNFQPAPIDLLQRAAIAWPNPTTFKNPLKAHAPPLFGYGPAFASRADHQRNMSTSSLASVQSSPSFYGPAPPALTAAPFNLAPGPGIPSSFTPYPNSSRSSSAYSTIPFSALPLSAPAAAAAAAAKSPAYPASTLNSQDHVRLRIPSDQLEKILNALGTPKPVDHSMPPPPLPQHVIASTQTEGNDVSAGEDRRLANVSDISMHPDYESFPVCTSEDNEGRVVHSPPVQGVRGRKEGAVDNHNRDFFSSVLNPDSTETSGGVTQSSSPPDKANPLTSSSPGTANVFTRKKTRSLTKATTDLSPEKVDKEMTKPVRKSQRRATAGPGTS